MSGKNCFQIAPHFYILWLICRTLCLANKIIMSSFYHCCLPSLLYIDMVKLWCISRASESIIHHTWMVCVSLPPVTCSWDTETRLGSSLNRCSRLTLNTQWLCKTMVSWTKAQMLWSIGMHAYCIHEDVICIEEGRVHPSFSLVLES